MGCYSCMAMPLFETDDEATAPAIEVRPSAVLELTWLLHQVVHGHAAVRPGSAAVMAIGEEIRADMAGLWAGDTECLPDTSILAERVGGLLTDEADTFLEGLERAAGGADGVTWELRSETPEVRASTLARLDRLRRERELAARYRALLARI